MVKIHWVVNNHKRQSDETSSNIEVTLDIKTVVLDGKYYSVTFCNSSYNSIRKGIILIDKRIQNL